MKLPWLAILLTVIVCVLRFYCPSRPVSTFTLTGSYEAMAHIVVGGLIALWWVTGRKSYGVCAGIMTAVEVVMGAMA